MSKRLSKDQRAAFIAEFEKEGKITSDPHYYVIKDKNDKLQVRRIRQSSPTKVKTAEGELPAIAEESVEEKAEKTPKEKTL